MGSSANPLELARKLTALSRELPRATEASVAEAALVVKAAVAAASGPYANSRLTRVTIKTSKATALVKMASRKAHLLDHDTAAHEISARRARALNTPFGPRASVAHPGTHGKLMWERGVAIARPAAVATVEARVNRTLLNVFGP